MIFQSQGEEMKKAIILALSTAMSFNLFAIQSVKRHHVPERLDQVRLIHPAAANKNHILVVNVGDAIPAQTWETVVTYAVSRLQINVWTNSIARFDAKDYLAQPTKLQKDFGEKTKIGVFVIDEPNQPRFYGAPGIWYVANVHGLREGTTDAQTVRDRYAKLILKGLAYASGGGASLDSNCSLFYGSFTRDGLDKTGIMICPTTYFPMLEILRTVGGGEMLTPAME